MTNRKSNNVLYLLIITTFLACLSTSVLFLIVTDDEPINDISEDTLKSFNVTDITGETNGYVRIVEVEDETVTIQGRIVESTSGYSHGVKSIQRENGTIKIAISRDTKSGITRPVITGYEYNLTLEDIQESDTKIEVIHRLDSRFSLNISEESTKTDGIVTDMLVKNTSLEPRENNYTTDITDEKIQINGNIVSSSGGAKPIVQSIKRDGDILDVVVGFDTVSEIEIRLITGFNYEISLYGMSGVETVNVFQKGVKTDELESEVPRVQ